MKSEDKEERIKASNLANLKLYHEIKNMVKIKEGKYRNCLEKISTSSFSENNIHNCVGKDLDFFYQDIEYEKMKIKARFAARIKSIMFEQCYKIAGLD